MNKGRFLQYVKENPQTYKDWGKNWAMKTDGKEDDLFSPYLEQPFDQVRRQGLFPAASRASAGPGA